MRWFCVKLLPELNLALSSSAPYQYVAHPFQNCAEDDGPFKEMVTIQSLTGYSAKLAELITEKDRIGSIGPHVWEEGAALVLIFGMKEMRVTPCLLLR